MSTSRAQSLLFLVHNPGFGGGQGQIARLREPLSRRGWAVTAAMAEGSEAARRLGEEGVCVEEVALHLLRAKADPRVHVALLGAMPREVRALRRLIRRLDVDVVQVHGDTNPHGAVAARLEGRAVVWSLYDTRTPVPLRRVTMPFVTRAADVITTWGRELGHVYPGTASLAERWIPIFPPVDGERFAPADARRPRRRGP